VEPKYEKEIETLDELLDSDVVYGYYPLVSFVQDTLSSELVNFLEHKKLKEDCSDVRKCVERLITQTHIAVSENEMFAAYVASELGFVDVGKVVCSLDDALMSAGATVFSRGEIPFWTVSTS
jgi:hypothetical protein